MLEVNLSFIILFPVMLAPTGFAPPHLTAGPTYIEVRWGKYILLFNIQYEQNKRLFWKLAISEFMSASSLKRVEKRSFCDGNWFYYTNECKLIFGRKTSHLDSL